MDKAKAFQHQGTLEHVVRKLFPSQKVESNARKKSDIKNPDTGAFLELDVWIPNLHICFEFQDLYHYMSTWDHQTPLHSIKMKDGFKQDVVLERGDTLVVVPFWWDGSEISLITEIKFARPDLLQHSSFNPEFLVALNPTSSVFKYGNIPDVGALMLASFPPLNSTFVDSISLDDVWWYGEKYDGVRSCWNPLKKKLYSRWGIEQQTLLSVASQYPKSFLDGEIWFGRGSFIDSMKVMGFDPSIVDWPSLRFVAFDNPQPDMFGDPFEVRYSSLLRVISPIHPFLTHAPRILCHYKQQLIAAMQEIIDHGGEGVVLRRVLSVYQHGRSTDLVKLKVTRNDMEALVSDVAGNTAKLQLPDGMTFSQELTPEYEGGKIKRGDIVTLAFENYSTRMLPKNPKIHRIRGDVTWEQVVADFSMKTPQSQNISETTQKMTGMYWSSDKSDDRAFFERIAKRRKFDPLVPKNWYRIPETYVKKQQGSKEILDAHEGQFSTALINAFPNIGLREDLFKYKTRTKWIDPANRRKCFIRLAAQRDFDPLVASNWYVMTTNAFDPIYSALSKKSLRMFPIDIGKMRQTGEQHLMHSRKSINLILSLLRIGIPSNKNLLRK